MGTLKQKRWLTLILIYDFLFVLASFLFPCRLSLLLLLRLMVGLGYCGVESPLAVHPLYCLPNSTKNKSELSWPPQGLSDCLTDRVLSLPPQAPSPCRRLKIKQLPGKPVGQHPFLNSLVILDKVLRLGYFSILAHKSVEGLTLSDLLCMSVNSIIS